MTAAALVLLALVASVPANEDKGSPISKIITMIGDLETKVIGEGEAAQKEYAEFSEWCEDTSKNTNFEIKTGKSQVADLSATIEKEAANIEEKTSKIDELGAQVASAEGDLKEATGIRKEEATDFAAAEKELKT